MNKIVKLKDQYLNKYISYIKNPNENALEMSKFLMHFHNVTSLWTEDLYYEYKKNINHNKSNEYVILKTNGSTNMKHSEYKWGPNFRTICDSIWNTMHRTNYSFKDKYCVFISKTNSITNKIRNEGIAISINPDKYIDLNIEKSMLIMFPHTLTYLIDCKHFIDFVKKTNSIISITGTDNCFYDFSKLKELEIPLINQMRSWKEGTAFYTCPYNKIHWMENLFYCTNNKKIFDLFNFHNNWWNKPGYNPDNIWIIEKDFKLCECGIWYRELNFQPYAIKWFYDFNGNISTRDNPFDEKLFKKKYKNIQIIQKSNLKDFEIYIDTDLLEQDFLYVHNSIKSIFKSSDFNINIINGTYEIGRNRKAPIFWSEYNKNKYSKTFRFNKIN